MKQRFLNAYPTRLAFLILAGIAAVVILRMRACLAVPGKIRLLRR